VRGDLKPRQRWAPAALAGILVLTGIIAFAASRRSGQNNRRLLADATAAASAQTVEALVHAQQAELITAGAMLNGHLPTSDGQARSDLRSLTEATPTATVGVAIAGSDGSLRFRPLLGPGVASPPLDLTASSNWKLALALARDGGTARTAESAGPDGRPVVLVALPLYSSAADTVSSRRADLTGYLVELLSPDVLAAPSFKGSAEDVGARLLDGTTSLASSPGAEGGPVPNSAAVVPLADPALNWRVAAWPRPTKSLIPWYFLLGGLVVAAIVWLVTAAELRASGRAETRALTQARDLQLIARVGPLLQRSLDVGEVLPVFATELSDELDLTSVAISRVGPGGQFVTVFSHGAPVIAPDRAEYLEVTPAVVAAGATVTLALQRAGRAIGALTIRARRGLEHSQVEALRGVTDLLSASLGNARIFQEEQEMVGRLRDLDRMKTTFLGSVSHELRTTVTAIKGFANLLAMPGLDLTDKERVDYLERIDRNAGSLSVLIDDLLDFARLERQSLTVTPQPVSLSQLVPNVVDQTSSILTDHPLEVDVAPGVVAQADPSAVERILVNLLSNAAKYTPPGTPVSVRLRREGTKAVLVVRDHGAGIPVEDRERIFDRFYRVDSPTTRSKRGVGIGLALVLELVGLLDGTITVDDGEGGGAAFTIVLPLAGTDSGTASATQLLST